MKLALSETPTPPNPPRPRRMRPPGRRLPPGAEWEEMVPAQFFSSDCETKRHQQPERRLMYAVLADALTTIVACEANPTRRPRLSRQTEAWFGADDWEWPFSFVNICQATGIDAASVRAWLSRRQARVH